MKSAFTLWANLDAAWDDSSTVQAYLTFSGNNLSVAFHVLAHMKSYDWIRGSLCWAKSKKQHFCQKIKKPINNSNFHYVFSWKILIRTTHVQVNAESIAVQFLNGKKFFICKQTDEHIGKDIGNVDRQPNLNFGQWQLIRTL